MCLSTIPNISVLYITSNREKGRSLTIVILFFLFGVSAKHFIDEDSTTVSQKETTGSATYKFKKVK